MIPLWMLVVCTIAAFVAGLMVQGVANERRRAEDLEEFREWVRRERQFLQWLGR